MFYPALICTRRDSRRAEIMAALRFYKNQQGAATYESFDLPVYFVAGIGVSSLFWGFGAMCR
ncbi:MAG TPA: hypothetical protein PKZ53_10330, partial [Acidobacteriota bacterium]|nr:hypothetical protein [Acidobacteriota bacterium]